MRFAGNTARRCPLVVMACAALVTCWRDGNLVQIGTMRVFEQLVRAASVLDGRRVQVWQYYHIVLGRNDQFRSAGLSAATADPPGTARSLIRVFAPPLPASRPPPSAHLQPHPPRTKVDDVVGGLIVQIVLDHHDRVALVDEFRQHVQQLVRVRKVEPWSVRPGCTASGRCP